MALEFKPPSEKQLLLLDDGSLLLLSDIEAKQYTYLQTNNGGMLLGVSPVSYEHALLLTNDGSLLLSTEVQPASGGDRVSELRVDFDTALNYQSKVNFEFTNDVGVLQTVKGQITLSYYYALELTYRTFDIANSTGVIRLDWELWRVGDWRTAGISSTTRPTFDLAWSPYVVTIQYPQISFSFDLMNYDRSFIQFANTTEVIEKQFPVADLSFVTEVIVQEHVRWTNANTTQVITAEHVGFGAEYTAERIGTPRYHNFDLNYYIKYGDHLYWSQSWEQQATAIRRDFNFAYIQAYAGYPELDIAYARNFSTVFPTFNFAYYASRKLWKGWTISVPHSTTAGVELSYGLLDRVIGGGSISSYLDDRIVQGFALEFNASSIVAGFDLSVRLTEIVVNGVKLDFPYTYSARSGGVLSSPLNDRVTGGATLSYQLLDHTLVSTNTIIVVPLFDSTPIVRTAELTISDPSGELVSGVPIISGEVTAEEGTFGWVGSFELERPADLLRFRPNDAFTFVLGADEYSFIVDAKTLTRTSPSEYRAQIKGISPGAILASPRATLITKTWVTPTMTHAIIQEVANNFSIEISILNWLIPANRFGVEDTSPLEIISQLAGAVGGVVDSTIDGILRVRPKYPISVPQWDVNTVEHVYSDELHVFSSEIEDAPIKMYNKFRIMDSEAGITGDRLEYTEITPISGEVRAYPSPWREDVFLDTTSPTCSIGPVTLETRREKEVIEIYNGEGQVKYPVYSVTSLEWMEVDLLGVNAGNDDTKITTSYPGDNFSLVRIDYQTRCLVYPVSGRLGQEAQFLLRDV